MPNFFTNLLQAPIANPFRVHNTKRTPKQLTKLGTKGNYHLTWERKELPGAGAGQYAYETLGLPPYPTFGYSGSHVTNPLRETSPFSYAFQAVGIVGNPPVSIAQGQFITQPLMDPDTAANIGVVAPGAVSPGPNAITNSSPVLAP